MDNFEINNVMPNELVQNDPIQYGNLTQALPEITSDISKNPSIILSEPLAQKINREFFFRRTGTVGYFV
ncbi:hypothetical protein RRG39_03450 [Mycoplasmopsis cynos]|uniref:hypothetical protein n=1 Tax=Mycoplasmopsis cynos TaxID=171284 RepID=UPI002AFDD19C|nr:hypothetical protein [Mycoplasmopsis cynos]WQQ16804.1 hypothetical protein RRG39_03450 [Mycoplasmopsis cynos]